VAECSPDGRRSPPRVVLLRDRRHDLDAAGRRARRRGTGLSGGEILASVPGAERVAEIEVREFGRYPGPHMTIERMWELRAAVLAAIADGADGVVITHGTDTIEETAYLLDRSLPVGVPVVVTGAMRNSSELSWDGPANLLAAIQVAATPGARERGAMVVMDDRIIQGAEVVKTHTEEFGTFRSPNWGPLGVVDKGEVLFYRESRRKPPLAPGRPALPSTWSRSWRAPTRDCSRRASPAARPAW
jgi:L-asparaginase